VSLYQSCSALCGVTDECCSGSAELVATTFVFNHKVTTMQSKFSYLHLRMFNILLMIFLPVGCCVLTDNQRGRKSGI